LKRVSLALYLGIHPAETCQSHCCGIPSISFPFPFIFN